MNKPKKTILKTIELFFKNHSEEKHTNPEVKDKSKKSILKVIDKEENLADRTTSTTFPNPSEPIISEGADFKTKKDDYEIKDLTKKEDIASTDIQPPREEDFNINNILSTLDKQLEESVGGQTLNILSTRSAKDHFKETALIEFQLHDKSYIVNLIVEKVDDKYNFTLKSSYGKEIYSKITDLTHLTESIYFPFNAIVLRDKFVPILNEASNKETRSNAITNHVLELMQNKDFNRMSNKEIVENVITYMESEFGVKSSSMLENEINDVIASCLEK